MSEYKQPMTTSAGTAESPSAGSRRRWYRLHWSTWIVMAFVLAVMTLMNGPRRPNNHGAFIGAPICYEHGWPFVFLDRFDPPSQWPTAGEDAILKEARDRKLLPWAEIPYNLGYLKGSVGTDDPIWMDGSNWTFTGKWYICWTGLLLDIATIALLVISLSVGYEVWSRRHWQYSLRFLLLVMLLVAVGMAWWRTAVNGVDKELRAAAALRDRGFVAVLKCDAPVFLHILVGTNRLRPFKHVCEILHDFTKSPPTLVTVADIERLSEFPRLRFLSLDNAQITDEEMESIQGLAGLEQLYLNNTRITDAGLKYFHDMPCLRLLDLDNTKITGTGFQYLNNLPQLRDFTLDQTPITDTSLSRLTAFPQIRTLSLDGTEVTDVGIQYLKKMRIENLCLNDTNITDSGLKNLESACQLKVIELKGTKVTGKGVRRFQHAIPNCRIEWDSEFDSEKAASKVEPGNE
jgi:hypothetical protein